MNFSEFFRQPRARQSIIAAVNAGALLALTASLAHWSWLIMPSPPLPASFALSDNAPAAQRPLNIQPLLLAHLFGQPPAIPTETEPTSIQPSSLNLVLTGVIGVKDAGVAIVSVNNQPEEPFVVGQTITGNAILQAVYPDRVTISRNGVLENLLLDLTASGALPPPSTPQFPRPMGQPGVPAMPPIHNFVNRDALLDKIRATDAFKKTAFAPVPGGLLVLQGQKGNILESFGVKEADVIHSVNGLNITNFEDIMRVNQSLLTSQGSIPIQIEIVRHGRPQTLQYRVE